MDKNNDIQVNKEDKWNKYIANLSLWQVKNRVDELVNNYGPKLSIEVIDAINGIYKALDEALDTFNELEDKCKSKDDALKKMIKEVADLEKEKIELEDRLVLQKRRDVVEILKKHNTISDLKADIRDLEAQASVNTSRHESELKQVIELAKSYGLIIYDERKDAIPDNVVNISMCGPYYVLDEQIKNENAFLKDRCNELSYRSAKYAWAIKTILKKATFSPGHVAEELRFMARKSTTPKDVQERWEGYADELLGEHSKLVEENEQLKKKIEKLENALNDKKVTTWEEVESEIFTPEEIAESQFRVEHMLCNAMRTHYIQLMADENKWLKKKDEEVKKENDKLKQTLLNILEKLETKVGLRRIHLLDSYEDRANLIMVEHDRLLIKYEKLKEENNNLTTDAKRLSDAVNAWFDMFNDMRHKRDDLKKECEKLKETNKSLRRLVRILDEERYC